MVTEAAIMSGIKSLRGLKRSHVQEHATAVSVERLAEVIGPYGVADSILFRRLIDADVLTFVTYLIHTAVRRSVQMWVPRSRDIPLSYRFDKSRFGVTEEMELVPAQVLSCGPVSGERWRVCYEARWYITADGLPKSVQAVIRKRDRAG